MIFQTKESQLALDSEDFIWVCRMVVGERSSRIHHDTTEIAAMLWAMVNRYLLHPGLPKWLAFAKKHKIEGSSFTQMIRLFSQPINPRWSIGGDLARKYRNHPAGSKARLKRRARIQALQINKIPKKVREDVAKFFRGELAPPDEFFSVPKFRISNWASYRGVESSHPGGVWVKGNYFLEDKALRSGIVVVNPWA